MKLMTAGDYKTILAASDSWNSFRAAAWWEFEQGVWKKVATLIPGFVSRNQTFNVITADGEEISVDIRLFHLGWTTLRVMLDPDSNKFHSTDLFEMNINRGGDLTQPHLARRIASDVKRWMETNGLIRPQ